MVGNYKAQEVEEKVIDFWNKQEIYRKAKEKNKGKQKFTYLDGPPYTSGKMHLGTAWGKSLRDSIMRFKRMNGFDVWDRAGFDMHGLPTENRVAAKLGLNSKEEIEEYGVEKFQEECEKFCLDNMKTMIEDFRRIGTWMDFDNPYMPIKPEFTEGIWNMTKKAWENKRLYLGAKVMTWCASCETSVSKHELEYENVKDTSIFVKFKIKDTENEHLIIWTTTPWTIPFNLGVMMNPDLEYLKVKVNAENDETKPEKEEVWVLAKAIANVFLSSVVGKKFEIVEEFKGEKMEGVHYEHVFHKEAPIYQEIADKHEHAFSVLMSADHVDTTAGTGLVHCAPGCGPEDYEVGRGYGLPAFNEIDETGTFSEKMNKFQGLRAKVDDVEFIKAIHGKGALVAKTKVEHDYPTCWRCHKPVVFRPTEQWFFKVEDLKEKMIEANKEITWVPKAAFNAFESWLKHLKDNGITRQRFWGTPVPVWECENKECDHKEVIGSLKELEEKTGSVPDNLHKPWIDKQKIKCPKCEAEMSRIPDIFDVWIDAGCAGFLCYDYPNNMEQFNKWFPADLILEGKDQIRGWFNLLMVTSMLQFDMPSFKNVYMHGFINDYRGMKMSKSIGNITSPDEVIEAHGADTLRNYVISSAKPGTDMNYNPEDPKTKVRNMLILWNLQKLLLDSVENNQIKPKSVLELDLGLEEKYILSKLNSTINEVTEKFNSFHLNEPPQIIEDFYLALSRDYVQFVREKLATGSDTEKEVIISVIAECLHKTVTLFCPVAPFITEEIFQNLKPLMGLEEESIHLQQWPTSEKELINRELEQKVELASRIIQAGLHGREKASVGVRWPIKTLTIATTNENLTKESLAEIENIIKSQLNIKEIEIIEKFDQVDYTVKPDYKKLGPLCGQDTPAAIAEFAKISAESIMQKLEEDNFVISINGNEYKVTEEHLAIEQNVAKGFVGAEFKEGNIYFATKMDPGLEAEGFARELMRRVQNARKNAGLVKTQDIDLAVVSKDQNLLDDFAKWSEQIAEKVGAKSVQFTTEEPTMEKKDSAKIKGKEFDIYFSVL